MKSICTEELAEVDTYRVLQPWEVNPRRLISWVEMLEFSARMFFWCGHELQSVKEDCLLGSFSGTSEERIFDMARDLGDKVRNKALNSLKRVEAEFCKVGMQITADTVKEILDDLEQKSIPHNFQWLIDKVNTVQGLAHKEMSGKRFLYVPAEQAQFFPKVNNQHIFGDAVANAFPSADYDISESGICLALARGTACVFHLMRVVELGLTALGNKFGVSLEHTNWSPAINQIESKIREMHKEPMWKDLPDCKDQQEFYAQIASHFGILKDAWRNYTMHARAKYTQDEAEIVFINTKAFMQKLSTRLSELP